VIALVITAIYYFVKQREKKIQKDNDLVLKMSELKLTALQSQMNPHFIFNSLNSIQNYIMQQKPVEAARYLSKFSRLIRRILDHSFNHLEPLTEIVETIKMYVELEAFRFSNEFKYTIELRDEDEIGRTELPPMLLQPFVENAIIHGLMPKEGEKHLKIIMEQKTGHVLISIDDNGVGRKGEVEKRPGHISRAEKIENDMLQTMESLQGVQPVINFIDKKDEQGNAAGTRVEITVPVK
jgi:sensor histidine kinase YesM